jgi:GNAT superfamily N-acetyltransferase
VIREIPEGETATAFAAMRELRTHLGDVDEFVRIVDGVQRRQGYRLVGCFVDGKEDAVAVAGFRRGNYLAWGDAIYVDDLSTLPGARRQGHARALLAWLDEEAERLGCDQLHLDSGVGLDRADAHRLYLNSGLVIAAHHFAKKI